MSDQPDMQVSVLELLQANREGILRLAEQHRAYNVRLFGSVARGEASAESDIDFLVSFHEGATIWDAVALWRKLGELLGREVDVVAEDSSGDSFMQRALEDSVPL